MKSKSLFLIILFFSKTIFAGDIMESPYLKEQVQPVIAKKTDVNRVSISYTEFAESMAYSNGVNYETKNNKMYIYITRCLVKAKCSPMVEREPLDKDNIWKIEVSLPYSGERIIMKYAADVEEEIFLQEQE